MAKISGMNFDISVGDLKIHVETATLDITDNSAVALTRGVPDGWVAGDVAATGELEVDTTNFNLVIEAAGKAGSFRQLETFDQLFYAKTPTDEIRVEAFGCRFKISSLLNIDAKGGEKTKHKLPFDVTSPDFIHINGVPYLSSDEIEGLS
ncbi:tail protein [Pseudomonas chlororaphis subsp. aurantiaca]|uniref:phage protein n=1 Tax=Pseudomonas chlororaphis TaxID=587753 RepID=UPI00050D4AFE|nr:phage protein [Pseudomonas chlororaphis]AIS15519.1 tail protein [Pseudomonas chlororaphis subsp. aurantiaca]